MNEDILNGMDNFAAVWGRVSSGGALAPGADLAGALRGFMDDERRDADYYTALSARFRGGSRETLLCHAADERRHFRALLLEYFLLTGESYAPPASCPALKGSLSALRLAYLHELEGAAAYRSAAAAAGSNDLCALYTSLAQDEERHAAENKALIARAI